ncbi:MAG: undecaprenyl/decaprenyl-phosphate alpha-N-acetylglucosaminyl 1-phosphate transferase [Phycisphaerales bacterium]|nr:undecaprenyl/decaprenyl-phosphate alpha-N-acetylglucosaminyl 1-phosphate transferase [Phycisphaerales bacterium]
MLTGLLDDIRHLSPVLRLFIQVAVAGCLLFAGVGRAVATALLEPCREGLPEFMLGPTTEIGLSAAFCAAVLAGATNATNLIDGLDGLCAGVLAIASLGFWVAYITVDTVFSFGAEHEILIIVLPLGTLGACLAFLRFNFNPASMFMGDSGSLLLGFNVAVFIVLFAEHASWRGLLAGLTIFGFPIYDTALALGRRGLNKKPLFVGDRSHFYDQIRDRGLSVRQTVLICYGLAFVFATLGVVMIHLSAIYMIAIFAALLLVGGLASWRFGMLRVDDAADRSKQPNA